MSSHPLKFPPAGSGLQHLLLPRAQRAKQYTYQTSSCSGRLRPWKSRRKRRQPSCWSWINKRYLVPFHEQRNKQVKVQWLAALFCSIEFCALSGIPNLTMAVKAISEEISFKTYSQKNWGELQREQGEHSEERLQG